MKTPMEKAKKLPGLSYAALSSGLELPVIDVSHPSFALDPSASEMEALISRYVEEQEKREKIPLFLRRLLLKVLLRRSLLAKGIAQAQGAYLSGINTYLMKLGPESIAWASSQSIDRQVAASLPALSMRLRLQDMARLLASSLEPLLQAKPGLPLQLLNLAGGHASDSLNALILLKKKKPGLLFGRSIEIAVLDMDSEGPNFAQACLRALSAPGAALEGLSISIKKTYYDWNAAGALASFLCSLDPKAPTALSSEGGLFEYGSDQIVSENLRALNSGLPEGAFIVGSVTRADGPAALLQRSSGIPLQPRSRAALEALTQSAGWQLTELITRPFCLDVLLKRPKLGA
jgi:hypothetical protein